MANKLRPADAIIQLLKDKLGKSRFVHWYHGDPIYLAKSALPCLIVQPNDSPVEVENTGQDHITHTLTIMVVVSKREEYGKTPDAVVAQIMLEDTMIGIDSTTNQYDPNTIVGALRQYMTVDNRFTFQTAIPRYGFSDRGETTSLPTAEAHCKVTCRELVTVPSRT